MYRRYSQVNESGVTLAQIKRSRLKDLIILLLIAAITASLIVGLPALQQRREMHGLYLQRIQSECDEAIRLTSTLSRNAGADSASMLARIRSNLYAIRMINSLNTSQRGKPLVSEDQMQTLQNTVDRYLTYLTTGMDTGEYQTNLQIALEELRDTISAVE